MNYNFSEDLKSIRDILGLTQTELAIELSVEQVTISRNELGETFPSSKLLESFYSFVFKQGIKLNKLKEMFWKEKLGRKTKLLFHGAKNELIGEIDIHHGRHNNDFGQGFYTGESYGQSISFISNFENSSVYIFSFDKENLKCKEYEVNQDWMLTIAYYHGRLNQYRNHPIIQSIIKESRNCDYIIAPIADNRMFQIINSFIEGEITDEQCKHCLAATNLGMQYIFISEKALSQLKLLEHCYVSKNEKERYKKFRDKDSKIGDDKVKLAKRKFRGQGKYIDEILE